MTVWPELLRRAMVGTERDAGPLPTLPPELAALLPAAEVELGTRLLTAAGLLALWRQAGRLPEQAEEASAPPAPPTRRACPREAAALLARMLDGEHAAALPVWLEQALGAGAAVPPTLLPGLLDAGANRPDIQTAIAECVGELGRWLATRNPDWQWLTDLPTGDATAEPPARVDWDEGGPAARLRWLRATRLRDPAAAREALAADWRSCPAKFRAQALEVLATDATRADEAFLEAALDDRALSVRSVATEALARLPGSQLLARLDERAVALLHYDPAGQGHLQATPPEELPADWERDGIQRQSPDGLGQRAWWLRQLIARIPPATWQAVFERDPQTLLAADLSPWESDLIEAWRQATVAWQDRPWALALLGRLQRDPKRFHAAADLGTLLDDRKARTMLAALCERGTLPPVWLAGRCLELWDDDLSALVERELLRSLSGAPSVYLVPESTVIWLCRAALQMPRADLIALSRRLHELPRPADWLLGLADRLGDCLTQRLQLDGILSTADLCAAVDYPRAPLPAAPEALDELSFRLRLISVWAAGDDRPAAAADPSPAAAG